MKKEVIIILLISLVLVGSCKTEKLPSEETKMKIANESIGGEHKTFLSLISLDIKPGEEKITYLVIQNLFNRDKEFNLMILEDSGKGVRGDTDWITYEPNFRLKSKQKLVIPIKVSIPKTTSKGLYFYDIGIVLGEDEGLYNKEQLFVEII